uniref:Scavenger receptor class B member 1 n=1 Tax=Echinostoma caproni TaxID=27848 RepID=A0A183AZL7_9TREM
LDRTMGFLFVGDPFSTISPYNAMWSHYPSVLPTNVGLFASQNGTKPIEYLVRTGADDIMKVGSIIEVDGETVYAHSSTRSKHLVKQLERAGAGNPSASPLKASTASIGNSYQIPRIMRLTLWNKKSYRASELNVWDHREANLINGSDGSSAPPGMKVGSVVNFYIKDICRSVVSYAVAKTHAINRPDLELLVFSGSPPDPRDPTSDWRERMFCKSGFGCPPKGLLALHPCLAAAGDAVPLYISQPYFLGADPRIAQAFDQFPDPIPERHSTWIHIEPTTGFILEAFKRIQFNLLMQNRDPVFKNMSGPYYFPIGWVEERAIADKDTLDLLYNKLFVPRKTIPFILSIIGAVSTLISILLIVLLITFSRRQSSLARAKRNGGKKHAPTTTSVNVDNKLGLSDRVQIIQPNQNASAPPEQRSTGPVPDTQGSLRQTKDGDMASMWMN